MRLKFFLPLLVVFLMSFTIRPDMLRKVFAFPKQFKEISAVEMTSKSDLIWTLEDSGGSAELYAFNKRGKLVNTLAITDAINIDWEELTSDPVGNIYIGDFGNNHNARTDLTIYKINASDLRKSSTKSASKITFYYPEQTEFPPKKTGRFYDLEAFFILNNTFYLFTKNRSSQSDGTTFLYTVPNEPGNHAAKRIGSIKTCPDITCAVTSADLSPDGTKMALLSYGHIWLFTGFKGDDFFGGKVKKIDFPSLTQKEGICFAGNNKLLITDERSGDTGGNLYKMRLESKP